MASRVLGILLAVIGCAACTPAPEPARSTATAGGEDLEHVRDEVAALRASIAAHELDVEDVERLAAALSAEWDAATSAFREAAEQHRLASVAWTAAGERHEATSEDLEAARDVLESARWRFELARQLIVIAAAIDAQNLDAFRARGFRGIERNDLTSCERVSTATMRRRLSAEGVDLTGLDVDHIVPHHLGGADHPANYQLLSSSLNRSLGATFDRQKCATAGLVICAAAVAISQRCGAYTGGLP